MLFSFRVKHQKFAYKLRHGEEILATLDKFLKTSKLHLTVLKNLRFSLEKEEESGLTAQRNVELVIKVLKFCRI